MVDVVIVVRETGRQSPDYSLDFELPEVPAIGAYISITRDKENELYSEDLIVRHVWWRLRHPTTAGVTSDREHGGVREIFVECDVAEGPHASTNWLRLVEGARSRGVEVERFGIDRMSIPQDVMEGLSKGGLDDD